MLQITNLTVAVGKKDILKGINMDVKNGDIAVIFGPNGCGKTTLLNSIMGLSKYRAEGGQIKFNGEEVNKWPIEKRARAGIGLMWQKPPRVAGVKLTEVIKAIGIKKGKIKEADELDVSKFLNRGVNEDLSGGELKRSELVQLLAQSPDLLLLDEPDSGVDIDNIKLIGEIVEGWRKNGKSILLVTHGGNLLRYISAKRVFVMIDGQIRCQGKPMEILKAVTECGYEGCVECQRRQKDG